MGRLLAERLAAGTNTFDWLDIEYTREAFSIEAQVGIGDDTFSLTWENLRPDEFWLSISWSCSHHGVPLDEGILEFTEKEEERWKVALSIVNCVGLAPLQVIQEGRKWKLLAGEEPILTGRIGLGDASREYRRLLLPAWLQTV